MPYIIVFAVLLILRNILLTTTFFNYFSLRIVPIWNSLPDSAVSAESVNSFKSRLDKFWSMHDFYLTIESIFTCCRKSSAIV